MIKHKDWDINEQITGRFKDGKPIIGVLFQNGLNDIEPDGSFVSCDMGVEEAAIGVTTHKVKRGRYGELRFSDIASTNKHLCKIKYKNGNGRSIKYIDADSDLPDVSNGKPKFNANNGITIEHIPTYKGVQIELVIADPATASLEYTFSVKDYGQNYTDELVDGSIISTGEDGKTITFHAPYAEDANGDIGQVYYVLLGKVDGYFRFKKVVDEAWFRQAAAPVRIDPTVTIEDGVDGGVIEDATMVAAVPDYNYGAYIYNALNDGSSVTFQQFVIYVDLSAYSNIIITSAKYIFDTVFVSGTPVSNQVTVNPSLRSWNEGNKSGATASTGEVTCNSARHIEETWTTIGGMGADTDYDSTISDTFNTPTVLGSFDVVLSVESVQSKIDTPATNYGDIFRGPQSSTGTLVRFASSEHTTETKPALYFEYTEAGWNPFFFDGGHF